MQRHPFPFADKSMLFYFFILNVLLCQFLFSVGLLAAFGFLAGSFHLVCLFFHHSWVIHLLRYVSLLGRGFLFNFIHWIWELEWLRTAYRPPSSFRSFAPSPPLHSLIQSVAFRHSTSWSDCPNGSIPEPPTNPAREAASHRFFSHRTKPTLRR